MPGDGRDELIHGHGNTLTIGGYSTSGKVLSTAIAALAHLLLETMVLAASHQTGAA